MVGWYAVMGSLEGLEPAYISTDTEADTGRLAFGLI